MAVTLIKEGRLWTADRDAELRKHHAEGLSSALIAARMGLTRNSVIGRVHRLGIQRGGQGIPAQRIKRVLAPKMPLPPTVKAKPLPPFGPPAMPVEALPTEPAPLEGSLNLTLLDLKPHQCKFPLGDPRSPGFAFCGAERVEGRPYCAEHVAKAYVRGSYLPRWLAEKAA